MNRPPKGKRPEASGAVPFQTAVASASEITRSSIIEADDADGNTPKNIATAQAKFALLGAELRKLPSGASLVHCSGFSRHCADWSDVLELLRFSGVPYV